MLPSKDNNYSPTTPILVHQESINVAVHYTPRYGNFAERSRTKYPVITIQTVGRLTAKLYLTIASVELEVE